MIVRTRRALVRSHEERKVIVYLVLIKAGKAKLCRAVHEQRRVISRANSCSVNHVGHGISIVVAQRVHVVVVELLCVRRESVSSHRCRGRVGIETLLRVFLDKHGVFVTGEGRDSRALLCVEVGAPLYVSGFCLSVGVLVKIICGAALRALGSCSLCFFRSSEFCDGFVILVIQAPILGFRFGLQFVVFAPHFVLREHFPGFSVHPVVAVALVNSPVIIEHLLELFCGANKVRVLFLEAGVLVQQRNVRRSGGVHAAVDLSLPVPGIRALGEALLLLDYVLNFVKKGLAQLCLVVKESGIQSDCSVLHLALCCFAQIGKPDGDLCNPRILAVKFLVIQNVADGSFAHSNLLRSCARVRQVSTYYEIAIQVSKLFRFASIQHVIAVISVHQSGEQFIIHVAEILHGVVNLNARATVVNLKPPLAIRALEPPGFLAYPVVLSRTFRFAKQTLRFVPSRKVGVHRLYSAEAAVRLAG